MLTGAVTDAEYIFVLMEQTIHKQKKIFFFFFHLSFYRYARHAVVYTSLTKKYILQKKRLIIFLSPSPDSGFAITTTCSKDTFSTL